MTLLIAVFTIFVFGGAITEVAIACDVPPPERRAAQAALVLDAASAARLRSP